MRKYFLLLLIVSTGITVKNFAQTSSYEQELNEWHSKRITSLKSENGWLNLAGLMWLQEGKNSFGSGDNVQIKFPKGTIAEDAGYFELKNGVITIYPTSSSNVKVNNQSLTKAIIFSPDSAKPAICTSGSLKWNIIKRDNKIGIRLRNLNSDNVKKFSGVERYVADSSYRVKAHLQKSLIPVSIPITNVLGQTVTQKSPGKLIFTLQGKQYTLDALEEEGKLFIVFGDATSGKETYPAGRFVYADMPDANGNTILDFNKAYNPPCAFTPYATCPLPPKQNILPLAITVGEKNYHVTK